MKPSAEKNDNSEMSTEKNLYLGSNAKLNWNILTLQKGDYGKYGQQFCMVALSVSLDLSAL